MGDEAPPTLEVTPPLAVNTINRTVYWYSRNQAVLMQQSLNGGEPEVRTEHRECLLGTVKPRNSNWGSIYSQPTSLGYSSKHVLSSTSM